MECSTASAARPDEIELEAEYDSEVFDTQLGDRRHWLEQQGVRLD